jgi:hypothetical protein
MRDIFTVQRISKRWKAVIATSPGIQEKMFLRLKTTPKRTFEPHAVGWLEDLLERPTPALVTLVTLNPEFKHVWNGSMRFGTSCIDYGMKVMLEWGPEQIGEHSSLLETYVSDPLCNRVHAGLHMNFRDRATMFPVAIWVDGVVKGLKEGLTIGDMVRAALKARGWRSSSEDARVRSYVTSNDFTLGEALDCLWKYTGIPMHLNRPLISIDLCLLDDVVTPMSEELASIAPKLRHESIPR